MVRLAVDSSDHPFDRLRMIGTSTQVRMGMAGGSVQSALGDRRKSDLVFEAGGGPKTILLLHGLFGTPEHWQEIIQQLSGSYRLIAPQLPIDHHPDRRRKGVQSIADLTDYLEDVIESLDLRDFVLCGNSLGGLIAIDYCLRHPAVPLGLVLAGSAGLYERSLTNGVKPRATREFVRQVISDIFYDDSLITEQLVDQWHGWASDRDYARFILRISRATRDRCVEHELCQLDLPTMIVWGRNDEITPPDVAETFRQQIRGAQLRYIERCGHAPNLEQPQIFAEILSDFLPQCFAKATSHRR